MNHQPTQSAPYCCHVADCKTEKALLTLGTHLKVQRLASKGNENVEEDKVMWLYQVLASISLSDWAVPTVDLCRHVHCIVFGSCL